MKDYCIWVVSPPGYVHSKAFDEVALSLHCAFRSLGFHAPIVHNYEDIKTCPIILGCNLLPSVDFFKLPETSIIFNLEQILIGSPWVTENYLNLISSFEIWDYSRQNMRKLLSLGISNVKYCGIGYVPELTRIKSTQLDIDILWYGSLNERRAKILQQLYNMGFKVKVLFGVYGEQRDVFIGQSKIVLNIHFYESKVLEIVRISYLLANRRFVISEKGNDPDLEEPIRDGLVLANFENLVEECLKYLNDDASRNEIAEKGFSRISSFSQVEYLKDVLNH